MGSPTAGVPAVGGSISPAVSARFAGRDVRDALAAACSRPATGTGEPSSEISSLDSSEVLPERLCGLHWAGQDRWKGARKIISSLPAKGRQLPQRLTPLRRRFVGLAPSELPSQPLRTFKARQQCLGRRRAVLDALPLPSLAGDPCLRRRRIRLVRRQGATSTAGWRTSPQKGQCGCMIRESQHPQCSLAH